MLQYFYLMSSKVKIFYELAYLLVASKVAEDGRVSQMYSFDSVPIVAWEKW